MAVAFDSVGPAAPSPGHTGATALSWSHTTVGAPCWVLVGAEVDSIAVSVPSTATLDGASMTSIGIRQASAGNNGYCQVFSISGISAGAHTIIVTPGTGAGDVAAGSIAFTGAAGLGTVFTATAAGSISVTSTQSGGMCAGFVAAGDAINSDTAPSTRRYLNNLMNAGGNATGNVDGATSPSTGSAVTMAWGLNTSNSGAIIAVELLASLPIPPPPTPVPRLAPGWFPGSAAVTEDPGGIPFYAQPQPTDATPAVIIPPYPEAAGLTDIGPQPPGWFPGSDKVTNVPGGIPFTQLPPPQGAAQPVVFRVPEVLGIADWLPLPPGWFPGAAQVTTDPGSIPFYSLPQPQNPPPKPVPPPVITQVTTGTGYFADQYGTPRFFMCDAGWGLIASAGRWGPPWQADIDNYLTTRAAQGFTAVLTTAIGTSHSGSPDDTGNTWDGIAPFTSAYTTFNNAYWARVDYFLGKAASLGIAVVLDVLFTYCLGSPANILFGINSGSNPNDYGVALGNRYKNIPNLIWHFGDDYDGSSFPAVFSGVIAGIRSTGDTHPSSIENTETGSTSRYDITDTTHSSPYAWDANVTHQWVYYYAQTYFSVEYAYGEPSPVPVVEGDGMYWGEVAGGNAANDQALRRQAWWAVSSGSRGYSTAQVAVHLWNGSGSAAAMTAGSWFTAWAGAMRTLMESLPNWQMLLPDVSSVLVTAGRGTRATYNGAAGQGWVDLTDAYVTVSRAADGSLAVIYLSHGTTITIDQTKMAAGYTATWVDPATCATSSTTPGTTYNSTAKGNNSTGDADWVLVLQGTPGGAANVAGVAAAVTVASPAGALAASANITGTAASVTVASPAGVFAGSANVTGIGAPVTVAAPAGTPASSASVTGLGAPVTVASPAGVPSSGSALTGIGAPVTVAGGAGVPSAAANVTGIAALVTVQGGAGVAFGGTSGSANVTGIAALVTVAAPAGTPSAAGNVTGIGALVTVASPAGTPASTASVTGLGAPVTVAGSAGAPSSTASVTGVGAPVPVAAPAGAPASTASVTGIGAPVPVAAPAGVAFGGTSGAANVTGIAAPVTVASPAGTPSGAAPVTGTAAHITTAAPTGVAAGITNVPGAAALITVAAAAGALSSAAKVTGVAALATVAAGTGTAAAPPTIVKAFSTAAVTAVDTSEATVTDPRDGTATVAGTTSTPSVS